MTAAKQLILFGSPGVGKSYHIRYNILPELGVDPNGANCVSCVFHPEYSYGDFVGKLLPISRGKNVEYTFFEGHFLKALAQAFQNLMRANKDGEPPENVALVIDELNRGNSAAIFGTAFQLLDRDTEGWSAYSIAFSGMEFDKLLALMRISVARDDFGAGKTYTLDGKPHADLSFLGGTNITDDRHVRIPPNLHILATVNTSDASIYYMDSAFKRRWDWQYVDVDSSVAANTGIAFNSRTEWEAFVIKLNSFIRSNSTFVRNMEDKQIGKYFIPDKIIARNQIQCKLLFFLWDSVFPRDRSPIEKLLKLPSGSLLTFGDLARRDEQFVKAVNALVL